MPGASDENGEVTGVYLTSIRKLPEQSSTTIRFFEKSGSGGDGEAYMTFGKDALLAAKEVFQTNAVIKTYGSGSNKLDCVVIKRINFETWVRDLLLVKQYRVEVYVTDSNTKGRIDWTLQYKGSPGNLTQFEDLLFSNSEVTVNNGVLGVRVGYSDKNKNIGLAFVNMNECQIHLIEFLDSDSFTNFESILVQLSPKEAVIPSSSPGHSEHIATVKKILERNGVLVSDRKLSDFETKDLHQDFGKLLKRKKGVEENVAANPELEKVVACSAMCGVIKYLELLSGDTYQHQFSLKPFDHNLYAKMDSAACRALHLSQNTLERSSGNETTLLSVIDKCRTAQGKRLLAQFVKQPLMDLEKLEERLDIVQILFEDIVLRQCLFEDHLRRVPDCQMIARKLLKKRATLQDCYRGYLSIVKLPNLLKDLESHDGSKRHILNSYFIDPINALQEDFNKFSEMITSTLDIKMAEKGEFVIRPDFDDDFQELRTAMDKVEQDMADETYSVARQLGLEANKSLKLESNSGLGYFFRITLKDEKLIRNNKSFSVIHSTKAGAAFRNSKLEKLSDQYLRKRRIYEEKQKDVVQEILDVAAGYSSCFEQLGNLVALLDVLTNFAVVAANSSSPYVRPKLRPMGDGVIKFEELRHPCVETQPNVNYIPNDIQFEKAKKFYIVSGPNMGGKSTFLRSVGIATLLAQIGCFVPATSAEISIVDGILARVGAGDCLTKGVSTFMAEMLETSYILKTSTLNTLVLIDELGRGTSTYDGFGLCWAISEYLAKTTRCFCVLATHFHELTALADEAENVVNVHFSALADENGLAMLYKLENGPCDRSFGIHVTQVTHFPEHVIETARDMVKKLEDFSQEEDKEDTEEAVKRRQTDKKDGLDVIQKFHADMREVYEKQNIAVEKGGMSYEEADSEFQKSCENLLAEVKEKSKKNMYLKHLLDQSNMV